jgi:hypothetical protein
MCAVTNVHKQSYQLLDKFVVLVTLSSISEIGFLHTSSLSAPSGQAAGFSLWILDSSLRYIVQEWCSKLPLWCCNAILILCSNRPLTQPLWFVSWAALQMSEAFALDAFVADKYKRSRYLWTKMK